MIEWRTPVALNDTVSNSAETHIQVNAVPEEHVHPFTAMTMRP